MSVYSAVMELEIFLIGEASRRYGLEKILLLLASADLTVMYTIFAT
jgi:hypothetical protein